MKSQKTKALSLSLKEVLDREFVREVLERKVREGTPKATLLKSSTSATLVRKKILNSLTKKAANEPRLSDLVAHTSSEVKRMAKLGAKTLRWLEEYLSLLGVVLPHTKSVHGMSREAQDFLASV